MSTGAGAAAGAGPAAAGAGPAAAGAGPAAAGAGPAAAAAGLGAAPPPPAEAEAVRWLAVLDFEATCWRDDRAKQSRETEVIELPTVLFEVRGAALEPAGEWRAFVRPTVNPVLTDFCVELTGISQAQVDAAKPLASALAAHAAWLALVTRGAPPEQLLFVTCGDWDLGTCLPLDLSNKGLRAPSAAYSRWVNIKREFASEFRIRGRAPDMADMLKLAGLRLEGRHHSGLDDSRNIGRILELLWRRGRRSFEVRTAPR